MDGRTDNGIFAGSDSPRKETQYEEEKLFSWGTLVPAMSTCACLLAVIHEWSSGVQHTHTHVLFLLLLPVTLDVTWTGWTAVRARGSPCRDTWYRFYPGRVEMQKRVLPFLGSRYLRYLSTSGKRNVWSMPLWWGGKGSHLLSDGDPAHLGVVC